MSTFLPNIAFQPFAIMKSGSTYGALGPISAPHGSVSHDRSTTSGSSLPSTSPGVMFGGTTFAGVPVLFEQQLQLAQYRELGEALKEMHEDTDTEWRIDSTVYSVALKTATVLMGAGFPPPAVFTHGSESVVFNWSNGRTDLYLTISGDRLSAMVAIPEKIQRRLTFTKEQFANPAPMLAAVHRSALGTSRSVVSNAVRSTDAVTW